jgi:transcriptional regulator with XRE-family HTH domain
MDMQIHAAKVRTERERRAWSQEHLAEVAGLSLRTIQRVENTGVASYESARALAAVFQTEVAALREVTRRPLARQWRYAGVAALLVLAFGAFFARDARAGEVLLDVAVAINNQQLGQHQTVANEGKSAEFRHDGQARVFVSPHVTQDGKILLSIRLEEPAGSRWVEVAEPRMLVLNGAEAVVNFTSDKGTVFRVTIRPRRV